MTYQAKTNWKPDDPVMETDYIRIEQGIADAHQLVKDLANELGGSFVVSGLTFTYTGLTANYAAGVAYVKGQRFSIPAGSIVLNANQGQYIYLDTDGVIKKSTSQAVADSVCPLWYFSTNASAVLSYTDRRNILSDTITVDQTQVPSSNTAKWPKFFSYFAYLFKSVTGEADWKTTPVKTIKQLWTDLSNHIADTVSHVTAAERTAWNAKETHAGAQAKADAVQTNLTNHINATDPHPGYALDSDLSAHVSQTNPHKTSASDVGAVPAAGGKMTGNLEMNSSRLAFTGPANFNTFLNVASHSAQASATGAIVINTPINTSVAVRAKIEGYCYNSNASFELVVGLYSNGTTTILNPGYLMQGSFRHTVRAARDASGKIVIILGNVTDTFPEAKISVSRVDVSKAPTLTQGDGWSISYGVTDLTPYSNQTTLTDKTGFALASDLTAHLSAADPHSQYQLKGTANTDVNKTKAVQLQTDTRSLVLTYTGNQLTKVEEMDGATAVKTTNLTYNGDGTLATTQEVAGGTTVTKTLAYTSGKLSGVTKAVTG
ncbi:hypothetical protein [Brevibacillus choshinensis]|uniref:Uncharacterized protein n=1 Tax=Brevibacillus choshinensis TaxID=54911 RepID=A0ABX7FGC0_BRECH|nr:hypothetical protein [Brevibacillus choshinensis]QRG65236.1 hypothetical protein JNE38_16465 [Brevibacillus choshinensis]